MIKNIRNIKSYHHMRASKEYRTSVLTWFLVVTAVFLGFIILAQRALRSQTQDQLSKSDQTARTTQPSSSTQNASSGQTTPSKNDLFMVFSKNLSPEESTHYIDLVSQASVLAPELKITAGCNVDPFVFRVPRVGDSFTIHNTDSTSHTLYFSPDSKFTLEAGEKITTAGDFKDPTGARLPGAWGYRCDANGELAGIVFIASR